MDVGLSRAGDSSLSNTTRYDMQKLSGLVVEPAGCGRLRFQNPQAAKRLAAYAQRPAHQRAPVWSGVAPIQIVALARL